jgi:hypothetical protein
VLSLAGGVSFEWLREEQEGQVFAAAGLVKKRGPVPGIRRIRLQAPADSSKAVPIASPSVQEVISVCTWLAASIDRCIWPAFSA